MTLSKMKNDCSSLEQGETVLFVYRNLAEWVKCQIRRASW